MDSSIQFSIYEFTKIFIITTVIVDNNKFSFNLIPKYYFLFIKNIVDKLDKEKKTINILNINYNFYVYIINNKLSIEKFMFINSKLINVKHCVCNINNNNNNYKFIEIPPFRSVEIEMLENFKNHLIRKKEILRIEYINL
tara:strand:+ start:2146 stop:2565 length:420 start_codon:yes stop_codon:yes gene_type:complete